MDPTERWFPITGTPLVVLSPFGVWPDLPNLDLHPGHHPITDFHGGCYEDKALPRLIFPGGKLTLRFIEDKTKFVLPGGLYFHTGRKPFWAPGGELFYRA